MIIQPVNVYKFQNAFCDAGRVDSFSCSGLEALHEYLEDLSDGIGEPIVLDVIALCCEYSEHSICDAIEEYGETVGFEWDTDLDVDDNHEAFIEALSDHTTVIRVDDETIIIGAF